EPAQGARDHPAVRALPEQRRVEGRADGRILDEEERERRPDREGHRVRANESRPAPCEAGRCDRTGTDGLSTAPDGGVAPRATLSRPRATPTRLRTPWGRTPARDGGAGFRVAPSSPLARTRGPPSGREAGEQPTTVS